MQDPPCANGRITLIAGASATDSSPQLATTTTEQGRMGIEVNLEGKIALVTGASSGLGNRFAQVLVAGRRHGRRSPRAASSA